MATNTDWSIWQRQILFCLLDIQAENSGVEVKGLKKRIAEAKAAMSKEDIAAVEKEIAELYD